MGQSFGLTHKMLVIFGIPNNILKMSLNKFIRSMLHLISLFVSFFFI